MAFIDDCIAEIEKAFRQRTGRNIEADELDSLLNQFMKRRKQRQSAEGVENLDKAVQDAANDYAKEMAVAAIIEKRNAALSLKARLESIDYIKTNFEKNPALGVESLLVGINSDKAGSRASVGAEQDMLKNFYVGGFMTDLERAGVLELFRSGTLDREVAKAMWALHRKDQLPTDAPSQVREMARIINKWQDIARKDANDAGAWIDRLEGYIVRQSHDQWAISKAGRRAWSDFIETKLDWNKIDLGEHNTRAEFLNAVYTGLASGVHLRSTVDGKQTGFKGPHNIAKSASQERVLHFKSADDWFNYNQEFGTRNLREAVFRGLDLSADRTGIMRKLGPNPEANLNMIVDSIKKDLFDAGLDKDLDKFNRFADGRMGHQLAAIDGTGRSPVNAMQANAWAAVRALQNMAKLGGAVISQFGDIPIFAQTMRRNGMNYFEGMNDSIMGLVRGKSSAQKREIGSAIGIYHRTLAGDVASRASVIDDNIPGSISRMQQLFFKLNLMGPWTDAQRHAAAMTLGNNLALSRKKEWAAINPDLRRMLSYYNIDSGKWDIVRDAHFRDAEGYEFIDPRMIADLPDERFKAYLEANNRPVTERSIARFKREVADSLRNYYVDQIGHAVIEPDARTRSYMQMGTRPGTLVGETVRLIGQFKSFSVAYIHKAVGPEVFGRGAETWREAIKNPNGEMVGLGQLIAGALVFGYLAMSGKDLVKGRNPRDPSNHETWMAAFVQGGGAGIYGDFLFGETKNRFGGGFLNTVAGPTIGGTATSIADLWGRVKKGDDTAAAAFKTFMSNVPAANLFYTRTALDYLILHSISEALNPGYLKRMERRIEKENDQTFWVRPSQNYLDPLGIAK